MANALDFSGNPYYVGQQPPPGQFPNTYTPPPSSETVGPGSGEMNLEQLRYQIGQGNLQGVPQLVQAMPQYQGITDAQGNVLSPYKYDPSKSGAFSRMTDIAMSKGPTDVYRAQADQIDLERSRDLDNMYRQGNIAGATGTSNLAQTGGLESGARERMAGANSLAQMQGQQNLYGTAATNRASALSNDAAMKMKMLGGVSDVQNAAQQYNIGNAISDQSNRYGANMNIWNMLGNIQGSSKIADLMENNPKYEGFFSNVESGKWSPFGMIPGRPGATGESDWVGKGLDEMNPLQQGKGWGGFGSGTGGGGPSLNVYGR